MNESTAMKSQDSAEMQASRDNETTLMPPVDIFEDAAGITIKADLPGVSRERLSIQVDKDTLAIDGEAAIDMPEGMQALYADLRSTRFRRSFTLSHELETDKISAEMKDGVLTLRIPKRPELKPRKIEISAG